MCIQTKVAEGDITIAMKEIFIEPSNMHQKHLLAEAIQIYIILKIISSSVCPA